MGEMRDRMLAGLPYLASDPEIVADEVRCQLLVDRYNATSVAQPAERAAVLAELLGGIGEGSVIRPPVRFDRGYQTTVGRRVFVNFGVVVLDVARVAIGDDVQIGPGVQLLTPTHPLDAAERRSGWESALPIAIGDDVWLGGGVIVCPGTSVGEGSVVGAGSVVTRDVPPGVVAAGNPCRVLRQL